MDQILEEIIRIEAISLAKYHKIYETNRVINIMKKTAADYYGFRLNESQQTTNPLENGLSFSPSLSEALVFLEPDKALDLFENSEIDELIIKTTIVRYLFNWQTFFYTHSELAELIQNFIKHLKNNKTSIISIGYPAKSFENSHWFYVRLSRLYPIKIPDSLQKGNLLLQKVAEIDNLVERDDESNLIFSYTWVKKRQTLLSSFNTENCAYEEAYLIDGFSKEDVDYIEEQRGKLFNLKLEILNIAYDYLTLKKTAIISGMSV